MNSDICLNCGHDKRQHIRSKCHDNPLCECDGLAPTISDKTKCPNKCENGWIYDPEWREHRQCHDPFHAPTSTEPTPESHPALDGWCCACEADQAWMEARIEEAKAEGYKKGFEDGKLHSPKNA